MYKNYLQKTVLITGGTSGIGSEIALLFAKKGWNVLLHYHINSKKAKALKSEIEKAGSSCSLFKADLSSPKQLKGLINKVKKLTIDTLINNAGTYVVNKHFSELALKDINATFMVNTFSPMLLTAKIFTNMKQKKSGRIVNVSSIAAKYGGSNCSMHYGASKLALECMTKTFAKEGAAYDVFVNTIRPGVIDTDFHKKFPKNMKKRIAMIPVKRMGKPKDVADMAYYLGSEKNNFITSEVITVSGGE